jgi:hypothetical protein
VDIFRLVAGFLSRIFKLGHYRTTPGFLPGVQYLRG